MNRKSNESLTLHNETTLMGIATAAKVTGWVILVIFVLSWVGSLIEMFSAGGFQFPPGFMNTLLYLANFVYPLAMGAFYFLIMHGLAQGLYIALDLFDTTEEEEVTVEM